MLLRRYFTRLMYGLVGALWGWALTFTVIHINVHPGDIHGFEYDVGELGGAMGGLGWIVAGLLAVLGFFFGYQFAIGVHEDGPNQLKLELEVQESVGERGVAPEFAQPPPKEFPQPPGQTRGKATASLVLGIIGLLAWLIPLVGFPVTLVGLVMGIKARKSADRKRAVAGVIMSSIGLGLSVILGAITLYVAVTGQLSQRGIASTVGVGNVTIHSAETKRD